MIDEYLTKLDMLPDYMRGGMKRWIEDAIPPGDFLYALLSNDLRGTFERADSTNETMVRTYLVYLYNYAPRGCWGSKENVEAWRGLNAA